MYKSKTYKSMKKPAIAEKNEQDKILFHWLGSDPITGTVRGSAHTHKADGEEGERETR